MVFSPDKEPDQLSVILPQLYLGAERDVTQERLAALGISYVLSVSRCSPQPSFLPQRQYLRIPIDDSLWDDLLPWIPQALQFIDAAMASGAAVLIHCAAGISRSPALAVAYIMYSLEMDLDHAYRFVKERRPSISPNFNFLGQLHHFQGTLSQKLSGSDLIIQPLTMQDAHLPSTDVSLTPVAYQTPADPSKAKQPHREDSYHTDKPEQTHSHSAGGGCPGPQTLFLRPRTLNQAVSDKEQEVKSLIQSPSHPVQLAPKPTEPQLPAITEINCSQLEKRKSLTLSLPSTPATNNQPTRRSATSQTVHKRETGVKHAANKQRNMAPTAEESQRETSPSRSRYREPGLLSPFSLTLNKLLDWGERMLLGGVLLAPVRMGQPTLPYQC
ncbi:dual specificity protein phosphatase 16 [Genypterus blacodes]|uniref:dual specificity protein phosphatase 16 n=1 Tax=Genypterus blacodes TaxID=154954 RepID=UPI003F75D14A